MGYGHDFQLFDGDPPPEIENAATSAKVTASGNSKVASLHLEQCHKRRARATGFYIWDRASNSFQTLAGVQAVLA